VDIFCVSLDSGIAEEHDRFRRREGSYKKALEVLELAADVGFITTISTCVSHDNIRSDGLRRVIALARDMGIDCQFNLAVPTGHWQDNQAIVLTEDDQAEVRRLLDTNSHCRLDLFHNWSEVGCGAIKEKLYLSAYGDIMPCPFIQISFGNLRHESLETIRARAFEVEPFRSYWPLCLAAEDRAFMERVVVHARSKGQPPVSFDPVGWNAAGPASPDEDCRPATAEPEGVARQERYTR
jgi:MoaA/NifB/PqqE/SkfB family radical SAM enzyme